MNFVTLKMDGNDLVQISDYGNAKGESARFPLINGGELRERLPNDSSGGTHLKISRSVVSHEDLLLVVKLQTRGTFEKFSDSNELQISVDMLRTGQDFACLMIRDRRLD